MIKTKGMVHYSIPVSDVEKSTKFYTDILGLRLVLETPDMTFLKSGEDETIVILARSETPIDPDPGETTRIHDAFRLDPDDYEASKEFITSRGVEIIREEDWPPPTAIAGRRFYLHDPDRNVIELIDWANPGEG